MSKKVLRVDMATNATARLKIKLKTYNCIYVFYYSSSVNISLQEKK